MAESWVEDLMATAPRPTPGFRERLRQELIATWRGEAPVTIPARGPLGRRWPLLLAVAAMLALLIAGLVAAAKGGLFGGDDRPADEPPPAPPTTRPGATTPHGMIAFVGGNRRDEDVPQFDEIYVVRADGSGLRALTSSPDDKVYLPAWSPSGDRLAYLRVGLRREVLDSGQVDFIPATQVQLVIVDPSTGRETYFLAGDPSIPGKSRWSGVWSLEWSPDGRSIVLNQADAAHFSIVDVDTGESTPVNGYNGLRWSPDGRWMALYSEDRAEVVVVPTTDVGLSDLADNPAGLPGARNLSLDDSRWITAPAWAPGGSAFALTVNPGEDWHPHVEIISVPDGTRRTVADQGFSPAWSPDGRRIAYMPDRTATCCGGGAPVDVITADGGESRQVGSSFIPPTWTPDGSAVVLLDEEGLYTVNSDTHQTTRLTPPRLRPSDASIGWLSGIETFDGSTGASGDFGPDSQPLPQTTAEEDASPGG
jgi:dipeptidyl aminopeptidase/acylaminoacyl peptidase